MNRVCWLVERTCTKKIDMYVQTQLREYTYIQIPDDPHRRHAANPATKTQPIFRSHVLAIIVILLADFSADLGIKSR